MGTTIFRHVLLLVLCWPYARSMENEEPPDEPIFDQIATASENVVQIVNKPPEDLKDLSSQLIPAMIDATVRYDNSNGFVPIAAPSHSQDQDSYYSKEPDPEWEDIFGEEENQMKNQTTKIFGENSDNHLEDDAAYATAARLFLNLSQSGTNRRSFNSQEGQNELELLKVKNNTPAIANYQDFYENLDESIDNDEDDDPGSSGRHRNKERGKRVENYVTNYGIGGTTGKSNHRDSPYGQYYSHGTSKDQRQQQASTYKSEKVASNYHRQETMNYDGHGQSAHAHSTGAASSLPRTNYEANDPSASGSKDYQDGYDSIPPSSSNAGKSRYRLSRPVVVVDSGNYKANVKFTGQSSGRNPSSSESASRGSSRPLDSTGSGSSHRYDVYTRGSRSRGYDRTEEAMDTSDSSSEYVEYTERPKRVNSSRRRPQAPETSKRLPKEHREVYDDVEYEDQRKRQNAGRSRTQTRTRTKTSHWNENDSLSESVEDRPYDVRSSEHVIPEQKPSKTHQVPRIKSTNTWSQLSPNIEISHSSGIEIDQAEKPNFILPVKVNLVPFANFDHASAIGTSQGFDVSNAVLQGFVTSSPLGALSTATPVLGTPQSFTVPNLQKNTATGVSTPVPDIIVGQNTFQSPTHALLLPQANFNNKFSQAFGAQFLPSTVAPIYTVTSSNGAQNIGTPGATNAFGVSQVQSAVPHLIVPQPTIQTLTNLLPIQPTADYNIQLNHHGLNAQNLIGQGNVQLAGLPTLTTSTSSSQSVEPVNIITANSQSGKHLFSGSTGNYVASASFTVGPHGQKQTARNNPQYQQSQNSQRYSKPQLQEGIFQLFKDPDLLTKAQTYIESASVVLPVSYSSSSTKNANQNQHSPGQSNYVLSKPGEQNHEYVKMQSNNAGSYESESRRQQSAGNKSPSWTFQNVENAIGQSNGNVNAITPPPTSKPRNSGGAHLPPVGAKNVQILNPNIKQSSLTSGTILYPYQTMPQYPTAVLTTPIPIFGTNFVTARPTILSTTTPEAVNLQTYVDSLTEIGAKGTHVDLKTAHNQDRPIFNPINFVPNIDVIRNQNVLNGKVIHNEPLQQGLNLVPLVPGGNFFKPSYAAQSELLTKPKLATDLEKYAEQMFKESLKTMYNSHKWNNDRKVHGQLSSKQNSSDSSDFVRLRSELQRLKASLPDSKRNREILEGHHSETKIRTTEPSKPSHSGGERKRPSALLTTLEELLKAHPTEPIHIYQGGKYSHVYSRPVEVDGSSAAIKNEFKNTKYIRDFLTPPKPTSFVSKSPFHDKSVKKRPGTGIQRFNNKGPRPLPMASGLVGNPPVNLETSATNNYAVHSKGPRFENFHNHGPIYERGNDLDPERPGLNDYRKTSSYPTFTTPIPENVVDFTNMSPTQSTKSKNNYLDFNHPRMHNLMGLMMKNKHLPGGNSQNYFRDKDELRHFFQQEKLRQQQMFYDDTLRDFQKKSDSNIDRSTIPTKA